MPYSRPWTTNRCRCVPVQPKAICSTACRPAIVVSAGISSRRQISGLTPRTTTRSWYTLGKGAGCMVSGMAPILASRCGRMAPGTVPPTVCPALVADLGSGKRPPVTVTINGHTYRTSVAPMGGAFMLPVSAEQRAAAGVAAGDEVDIDIEVDTQPREVSVPQDLGDALDGDPQARTFFDGLSYSNRLRHVLSIEGAKTAETRQRRIV